MQRILTCFSRIGKPALAGLLAAWLLCSSLIAASPGLHLSLHDDAGQDSHQCPITLLEQQQVLASDPVPVLASVAPEISSAALLNSQFDPTSEVNWLPPGRAPPVSSLL